MGSIDAAKRLINYSRHHPVGMQQPIRTIVRILHWQMRSRLLPGPHDCRWIGGARLVCERGMSGATGNLYFGLHEFADMAFMLHFLLPGELMLDIGANVGTYTILAAKLRKAQVISFEPDPATAARLDRNIAANDLTDRVEVRRHALGAHAGEIGFTTGLDAMNRVTDNPAETGQQVQLERLDTALAGQQPTMIKIDVEGYEDAVFAGAGTTLSAPSLLSVEAETVSDASHDLLTSHAFVRHWYDPATRRLSPTAIENQANNRLYLREAGAVAERLRNAPPINLFGWQV